MNKFDYDKNDIVDALIKVGIVNGDKIFVHSNIGFFGILKNANNEIDYWKFFKDAIFQVIGDNGTIIVPTFSYSFCSKNKFDLNTTPGTVGMFSEWVRKDPDSIRSEDANFSVSSIGKDAEYFTKNVSRHSFGENSFWERFIRYQGKICCFNVGLTYNTLIHYVEKLLEVPYRYDKSFDGIFTNHRIKERRSYTHFVRNLSDPNTLPDLKKLNEIAYELKKAKDAELGRGKVSCILAQDILEIIQKQIQLDPYFLIKGKPSKNSFT